MTAPPIHPHELLDLADRLVGRDAGKGRPTSVELRRAVIGAYYAVFHQLAYRATEELSREGGGWSSRAAEVSRWVTHADPKNLCIAAIGPGHRGTRLALGVLDVDVVRIADAVITLQAERHRADYDDLYDVSKANALGLIDSAREAVLKSDDLIARGDPTYQLFLRLMLSAAQAKTRSA